MLFAENQTQSKGVKAMRSRALNLLERVAEQNLNNTPPPPPPPMDDVDYTTGIIANYLRKLDFLSRTELSQKLIHDSYDFMIKHLN